MIYFLLAVLVVLFCALGATCWMVARLTQGWDGNGWSH